MKDLNIVEQSKQTKNHLEVYAKNQMQLYKFNLAEKLARLSTFIFIGFFISLLTLLALISLSLAAGIYLGGVFGSYTLASLAVAFGYVILGTIIYATRKTIFLNPLLRSWIKELEK